MSSHAPSLRREDGVSLITVMVALAIVGILMAVVMTFAKNSINAAKAIERLGELEDVRRLIRARMDCATTKTRMAGGRNIAFFGRDGQPITATNPTTNEMSVGDWKFTATAYDPTTGRFTVSARHPKQAAESVLFRAVPLVCP